MSEVTDEMVERAAKAIENELDYRYFPQNHNGWASLTDMQVRMFKSAARLALEAAHKPLTMENER